MDDAPNTHPTPQDSLDAERRIAALTGLSLDSARTFLEFHSGQRALRHDEPKG